LLHLYKIDFEFTFVTQICNFVLLTPANVQGAPYSYF